MTRMADDGSACGERIGAGAIGVRGRDERIIGGAVTAPLSRTQGRDVAREGRERPSIPCAFHGVALGRRENFEIIEGHRVARGAAFFGRSAGSGWCGWHSPARVLSRLLLEERRALKVSTVVTGSPCRRCRRRIFKRRGPSHENRMRCGERRLRVGASHRRIRLRVLKYLKSAACVHVPL